MICADEGSRLTISLKLSLIDLTTSNMPPGFVYNTVTYSRARVLPSLWIARTLDLVVQDCCILDIEEPGVGYAMECI